jgi:RNA polymerase sigma-70 factor (ECF subfamily)
VGELVEPMRRAAALARPIVGTRSQGTPVASRAYKGVVVDRPPEQELLERARAGDDDAYAELLRAHQQVAFRTAWLICGRASEAEDVTQEAFIKAWRALPRFRAGAPFRPWLLTIVANEARSRGRRAQRQLRLGAQLVAHARLSGDAVPSPEAALITREDVAEITKAMAALNDRDRQIVSLRYLLDLSEEEIAGVLAVRRGTVKSRLSRALARLRANLEVADELA